MGPAEAKNEYRYQILIKAASLESRPLGRREMRSRIGDCPAVAGKSAIFGSAMRSSTLMEERIAYMLPYMSMVRTTVYLDQEVALALRQLAAQRGRSQAELIRDALAKYTARAVRPMPVGIGKYRSGEPDVAQRAKDILAAAAKRGRWR